MLSLKYLIVSLSDVYSMLIFVYVMLSWFPTDRGILADINTVLGKICDPYLNLFKKFIPPIGGMVDVSPIVAFLEHVADEIDNLNNQIADLQDQLNDSRFDGFDTPAKPIEEAPVAAPAPSSAPAQDFSQELDEANARIRELESQLEEKQADGNAIAQALIIAQRSADEILAKANNTAAETIQDAKDEAQRIIDRANTDRQDVIDAIRKLQDDREDPQARRDWRRLSGFRRCGALRRHHRCDGAGPGSHERRAHGVFHAPDGQRSRGGGNPYALCGGEGPLGLR